MCSVHSFPRVGHGVGQRRSQHRCGSTFSGSGMVAFCAAGNNERVSKRRHRATGRSAMLPPGGSAGFWYGSKCGSKRFQRIKKRRQNIVDDRTYDGPVGILVMMHQPVPQARNFHPRNIGMLRLKVLRQVSGVFADVIKGRCDSPLNGFLCEDPVRSDTFFRHIAQELFHSLSHFRNSLLVVVLHAICTPSAITAS